MLEGLDEVAWSAMGHAYGSAGDVPALLRALSSSDVADRSGALAVFYGTVHHQGDVYACTTMSLPFLFELAAETETPDRAAIVDLLVSIGRTALERCEVEYDEPLDYVGAARAVRERAELFVDFASDANRELRRAAIPGLGLFLDDTVRASAVLRGRMLAERGLVERLLVMDAMAALAIRLPATAPDAIAWFARFSADAGTDPTIRLAGVVQQARCAPDRIGEDVVAAAISLLRQIPLPPSASDGARLDASEPAPVTGMPPQVVAAFADMDRRTQAHAPTTDLLHTFHEVLAARVPERSALLMEQLLGPEPGARLDAIQMSGKLINGWRGDHAALITRVAESLDATVHDVAAEAASVLGVCYPIAQPAREALAACVGAHHATYGPRVWTASDPRLRRAHQEAVVALARLGDTRAVPSVLAGLDSGVDEWRAIQVAGTLSQAADQLVPRLCEHLRRVDLAQGLVEMSTRSMLSALAALADPEALSVIVETLIAAGQHAQGQVICAALRALGTFGPVATPWLDEIRPLITAPDGQVRLAAVGAVWAIGRDQQEIMPLVDHLLTQPSFWAILAADILGEIGPPAIAALPRLRERLTDNYEWVRVHCAAAIWHIGGEAQAPTVLDTLLQAWQHNRATANHVVACLNHMGPAARPALPMLQAELARPERGGRFASIDNDEELQRASRATIAALVQADEPTAHER